MGSRTKDILYIMHQAIMCTRTRTSRNIRIHERHGMVDQNPYRRSFLSPSIFFRSNITRYNGKKNNWLLIRRYLLYSILFFFLARFAIFYRFFSPAMFHLFSGQGCLPVSFGSCILSWIRLLFRNNLYAPLVFMWKPWKGAGFACSEWLRFRVESSS